MQIARAASGGRRLTKLTTSGSTGYRVCELPALDCVHINGIFHLDCIVLEKSVCVGGGRGGGGGYCCTYICIQKAYFVCKTCGFLFCKPSGTKKKKL